MFSYNTSNVEAKALTNQNISINGLDKIVDSKGKSIITHSEVRELLENLVDISDIKKNSSKKVKYSYADIDGGTSYIDLKLEVKKNKLIVSKVENNQSAIANLTLDKPSNLITVKRGFKPKPKNPKQKPKAKLKNTTKVPYKKGGGSMKKDFINTHAYNKHKYNKKKKSTEKQTQYGKNVDVKKLRELTLKYPEQAWSTKSGNGPWRTFYKKAFKSNLSTNDSKTVHHRVIINNGDSSKSTQFPLYFKKK